MRFSFAWIPTTQFFVNEREATKTLIRKEIYRRTKELTIREETNALENVLDDDRFEHVQLESLSELLSGIASATHTSNWPLEPAMLMTVLLPMT